MSEQKLWIKKRTSRGHGRAVKSRPTVSVKNIGRDVKKNQVAYSHYILKLCLLFALGLVWVRLGVGIGPLTALPLGLIIGLVIILLEPIAHTRGAELCMVLAAAVLSFMLPIGIIL